MECKFNLHGQTAHKCLSCELLTNVLGVGVVVSAAGEHIPVTELDAKLVATYVKDMKEKYEEVFDPFKKNCKTKKVSFFVLLVFCMNLAIFCSNLQSQNHRTSVRSSL